MADTAKAAAELSGLKSRTIAPRTGSLAIRRLQPRQISICLIHPLEQKQTWWGASAWGDYSTPSSGCPQDSGKRWFWRLRG